MRFRSDKFALATNLSSFHRDVVVPGCEEVIHVPLGDYENVLDWVAYDAGIVFRAKSGQLAVAVFSKNFSKEDYIRELPLKAFVTPL